MRSVRTSLAPGNNNRISKTTCSLKFCITVLRISQLFGVFPLHTVMNRLPREMLFKSTSWAAVLSMVANFGGYAVSALSLKRLARSGLDAINIAEPFFFAVCATSAVLFWALAKEWQFVVTVWAETERVFLRKPFRGKRLKSSIRRTAIVVLMLALGK
ncbi:gustatory receptor for sugar taste 64a-like [Aedes albopictus]|uniref:Secreted protein n=1 Tax=Aedes albopictus TaxID=7160 RepID=A0ABM1XUJ9_AEDAL